MELQLSHLQHGGKLRHCLFFFFFNYLATTGSVSCKKVVSSRELEAKSLSEGDLKRKAGRESVQVGVFLFAT